MAVLLPIWSTKGITAQRVRQRIGAVMKWAIAKGYRADNCCLSDCFDTDFSDCFSGYGARFFGLFEFYRQGMR